MAGNKVLATARDIESLRELSERYGDQVKLFELDVTDELSAAGAVKTAIDAFGSLDVVINMQDMAISRPSKIRRCRISAHR
jgi:NADP-dependent 3-hydroxy acid dehydrogenase YdfG